jgi:hypothetical protein
MDYLTPQSMAEMESERQRLAQRQQLMQAMMGGNYIPDSGRAGVATSILGSIIGAIGGKRNNEDIRAFMERSFEADNQKAQAEFERKQREEQKKFEREIEAASRKAQAEAKAKRDFATKEFTGGGVFDPSTGQFTGSPEWMQQQLGLKSAEARIAAANRAPAADPFAKIKAAVQAGVITPEEAQQAMKQDLIGGSRQSAPSGYKFTADGGLEPIPGGPADTSKPAVLGQEARNKLALIDNALANAKSYQGRVVKGDEFDDIASMTGDTPQLMKSAIQDMLYAKSGASAPVEEVRKAEDMYGPSRMMGIPTERDATAAAKVQNFIADLERMRGQITGQPGQPAAQSGGADMQAILAELQRRGVNVGG